MPERREEPGGYLPEPPLLDNPVVPYNLVSGHYRQPTGYFSYRSRGCPTWYLSYTAGGRGYFADETRGRVVYSRCGDILVWEPDTPQEYGTSAGIWVQDWVHFHPRPTWSRWLKLPLVPGIPGLRRTHIGSLVLRNKVQATFRELHLNIKLEEAVRAEIAMNGVERILLSAWEGYSDVAGQLMDGRIQAALETIHAGAGDKLSVSALAGKAGLSPSRFAHLFRKETGQSVQKAVIQARMREAAWQVIYSFAPFHTIAENLGFSTPEYLSAQFKKVYGMSPRNYRKQHHRQGAARTR